VFKHSELVARAERQQMQTVEAPAKRGDIVDRNGRLLAYSVDRSLWAIRLTSKASTRPPPGSAQP
jgi:cell division protein FtsI/penicillin-binding protein 2